VTATIEVRIATELSARPEQVAAAVKLLDEVSTVPFIARYRKEATGGLDDIQLRALEERLGYLRELEERRTAITSRNPAPETAARSRRGTRPDRALHSGRRGMADPGRVWAQPGQPHGDRRGGRRDAPTKDRNEVDGFGVHGQYEGRQTPIA